MGGDWLAAGATGPANSEGPGGCSGGLVKGVQRAALAEQALPWGQEVAGTPSPFSPTYWVLKENEIPFAAPVCTWAW